MKRLFIEERQLFQTQPENEAKLLEQLDHPNIIKKHDHFYHKKFFCLIMEYADKGDLDTMIKKLRVKEEYLSEKKVLDLFCQLCLAVKYLHDKKYIHRDIKIHNIFLTNNDIVKLGDFGISIQLENSEIFAKTQLGTPYYLSPEVIQGKNYDQKVDIWMMGCFLYEICEFVKPFQGKTWPEVDYKIQNTEPQPIDDQYSEFIIKLAVQMLQKDPKQRPSINDILNMPEIIDNLKQMSEDEVYKEYLIFPESIYDEINENDQTVIKYSSSQSKSENEQENIKKNKDEEDELAKYSLSYLLKKAEESIQKEEMLNRRQKQESQEKKSLKNILIESNQDVQEKEMNEINQGDLDKNLNNQQQNIQIQQDNQNVKKNKFKQIFLEKQKEELNIKSINANMENQEMDQEQNIYIFQNNRETSYDNTTGPVRNNSISSTPKINSNIFANSYDADTQQISLLSQNSIIINQQNQEEISNQNDFDEQNNNIQNKVSQISRLSQSIYGNDNNQIIDNQREQNSCQIKTIQVDQSSECRQSFKNNSIQQFQQQGSQNSISSQPNQIQQNLSTQSSTYQANNQQLPPLNMYQYSQQQYQQQLQQQQLHKQQYQYSYQQQNQQQPQTFQQQLQYQQSQLQQLQQQQLYQQQHQQMLQQQQQQKSKSQFQKQHSEQQNFYSKIINNNDAQNNNVNNKIPVSGQPTTKQNPQSFNFSYNYNNNLLKMPQSPNRTILFSDFLKQKLGKEKFLKMKQLLESNPNPLKVLDENTQLIVEIIGNENIDCIKMFRCLITSSVTPPSSHFRARSTANSPNQIHTHKHPQTSQQNPLHGHTSHHSQGNQQFSIQLKSANSQDQHQNQMHSTQNSHQNHFSRNNNSLSINPNIRAIKNQNYYQNNAQYQMSGQLSVGNSPCYINNNRLFDNLNNNYPHNFDYNLESDCQQLLQEEGTFNPQQMSKSGIHTLQNQSNIQYAQQMSQSQIQLQNLKSNLS